MAKHAQGSRTGWMSNTGSLVCWISPDGTVGNPVEALRGWTSGRQEISGGQALKSEALFLSLFHFYFLLCGDVHR